MRLFCCTSDRYHHVLKAFCFLFNRFWWEEIEVIVLGYEKPKFSLPNNFEFVSLGKQTNINDWANDLRNYYSTIKDDFFLWTMEDTFITEAVNKDYFLAMQSCLDTNILRADLTVFIGKHGASTYKIIDDFEIMRANQNANWKCSAQFAIWNREEMSRYLCKDYSPWDFERKGSIVAKKDPSLVLGLREEKPIVKKNEGVRVQEITLLNLDDLSQNTIDEMIDLGIITGEKVRHNLPISESFQYKANQI